MECVVCGVARGAGTWDAELWEEIERRRQGGHAGGGHRATKREARRGPGGGGRGEEGRGEEGRGWGAGGARRGRGRDRGIRRLHSLPSTTTSHDSLRGKAQDAHGFDLSEDADGLRLSVAIVRWRLSEVLDSLGWEGVYGWVLAWVGFGVEFRGRIGGAGLIGLGLAPPPHPTLRSPPLPPCPTSNMKLRHEVMMSTMMNAARNTATRLEPGKHEHRVVSSTQGLVGVPSDAGWWRRVEMPSP